MLKILCFRNYIHKYFFTMERSKQNKYSGTGRQVEGRYYLDIQYTLLQDSSNIYQRHCNTIIR